MLLSVFLHSCNFALHLNPFPLARANPLIFRLCPRIKVLFGEQSSRPAPVSNDYRWLARYVRQMPKYLATWIAWNARGKRFVRGALKGTSLYQPSLPSDRESSFESSHVSAKNNHLFLSRELPLQGGKWFVTSTSTLHNLNGRRPINACTSGPWVARCIRREIHPLFESIMCNAWN